MVSNILVSGVPGIEKCFYIRVGDDWMIQTKGENFKGIFEVQDLNHTRTISNNPHNVYSCLGIEAARAALMREFEKNFSLGDSRIEKKHLEVLCDCLCYSGRWAAANFHGLKEEQIGIISKLCFERPLTAIVEGAIKSNTDDISSASASIMLGTPIGGGSNFFDVRLDTDMISINESLRRENIDTKTLRIEDDSNEMIII